MPQKPMAAAASLGGEDCAFRELTDAERLTHLNSLIECAHDGIFSTDLRLRVVSWNPAAERIYGYTAQEMIGRPANPILPKQIHSELSDLLDELLSGKVRHPFETRRLRKDGSEIDVFLTVSPVKGHDGTIVGMSVIARDITERKRVEAELRRKQFEMEDYLENAVIALHWVGADGKILWANRAEMHMLGYQPHEYIGHHISEFHADQEKIEDILCRLTRNEKLHGYEARLRCKDGSVRDVLIHSSVFFEKDQFVHTRCFTMDVTERKRTEEALRRTEKLAATGRFAATIAHEINNPLEAVTNLIYLAQTTDSLEKAKEYLATAETELGRVSTIAKQTLGFFRDGVKPRNIVMKEVVRSVLHMLKQQIAGKRLDVKLEAEGMAQVFGMEGELRQVVANLVANSIDASAMDGAIRIVLDEAHGRLRLAVIDQGSGIDACVRSRLFTPFFTTKGVQGTGLGLWVSREIVQKHGGSIRYRSVKGRGTMFVVSLPIEARQMTTAA